jgi:hypothetical protein
MARSAHIKPTSDLISGGIFSQRARRNSKPRQEPNSKEMINDYSGLMADLLLALTEVVDRTYPNADFLSNQSGSKIDPDTKLSFIIRTIFGLSQMSMKPELINNYQKTLKNYLEDTQHDATKKEQYTEILNITKSYQAIATAIEGQKQIQAELNRLNTLGLPAKTIDRRLRMEWVEPCIQKNVVNLTAQLPKMMRSSKRLQSAKLAGRNNSLASLSRLVSMESESTTRKQTRNREELPKINEDKFVDYQASVSPAAAA